MTDKKKIVLIYSGVAVFSVLILGMSFFLTTLKKQQREQQPPVTGVGKEDVPVLNLLRQDIELERQNGEKVRISSLHDKVWVAAQFYASCPMCAARNQASLVKVYNEFKDDEDFMVACFSIDPEHDTPELLGQVRDQLEVDESNWWFLKAEQREMWDYLENQMGFLGVRARVDEIEIQQKGKWQHDIGLQVYRGTALVHVWKPGDPNDTESTAKALEELSDEVRKALTELKDQKKKTVATAETP